MVSNHKTDPIIISLLILFLTSLSNFSYGIGLKKIVNSDTLEVTAKSISEVSIADVHMDVTCNGYSDGWIRIYATGGSGNYTYNWAHTEENTNYVENLFVGEYFVTVTNQFNCQVVNAFK